MASWKAAPWIGTLGANELIAKYAVPAAAGEDDELARVRAIGVGSRDALATRLRGQAVEMADRLADVIWDGARALSSAGAATGHELHTKFVQDGGAFTMSYGGLDTFFGGLEGLIGAPIPKLIDAMRREHCER